MVMTLSNYEIRAYKNQKGFYNLHCRTFLIAETNASFSFGAYLKEFSVHTHISGEDLVFMKFRQIPYSGQTQPPHMGVFSFGGSYG